MQRMIWVLMAGSVFFLSSVSTGNAACNAKECQSCIEKVLMLIGTESDRLWDEGIEANKIPVESRNEDQKKAVGYLSGGPSMAGLIKRRELDITRCAESTKCHLTRPVQNGPRVCNEPAKK